MAIRVRCFAYAVRSVGQFVQPQALGAKEPIQEGISVLGRCRFRVELEADYGMLAMHNRHDLPIVSGGKNVQRIRKRLPGNRE
jgi:hypothetical protein